ncbi:MAG: DHA2 family efflux MFS transporter permease subunit [Deltaproteobacteria bacterium]|nr:DHA2 family efflux MFS transporter permease subunit [Deltaproteobacteria bacterium]
MEHGAITGSKIRITAAVMSAAMMAVLDISIVNVALNEIRASFGTPLDQIAWVSTGYMMANVIVIPMTGWFQRRFGFRRYFVTSILVFGISSMLCGLAWNLPSLVAFRVMQGMGGGAIIPTAQSILFARYPRREHGVAQALFGMGAVTAPLLGPTVGGYLTEVASWHWIFLINIPFVLLAAGLAWTSIEEPGWTASRERVDAPGISLLIVGMASLQYVLEEGNRDNWFESRTILVLSIIAAVSLVTFVVHELETRNPVVDLRIFGNRSYAAATGLNFMVGMTLFSAIFLFSLYCGSVMSYRAIDIGILFLKGSAIQLLLLPIIGRLLTRVDARPLILLGSAVMVFSLWVNAGLTNLADEHAMLVPVFIRACGLGFIFAPLNVTALSDLPADRRGNAAGLFNLTRELGGSIGTAWMSTMLSRNLGEHYTALTAHVSIFDPATMEQLAMARRFLAGKVPDVGSGGLALLKGRIMAQALVESFSHGFLSLMLAFAGAMLLVFLLRRPRVGADAG